MAIGDYFNMVGDQITNLNQQWLFTNSGAINRIEYYSEKLASNDSGLRISTQGFGSSMVLGSYQRGGLSGTAVYVSNYQHTNLLLRFDGDLSDSGPSGLTFVMSGVEAYSAGKIGSGIDLDGGSYVVSPNESDRWIINPSGGAVEAWVSGLGTDRHTIFWIGENSTNPSAEIVLEKLSVFHNPQFIIRQGGNIILQATGFEDMTAGTRHIRGVWNGSGNYGYVIVDGMFIDSGLQTHTIDPSGYIGPRIGARARSTLAPLRIWEGGIDDVRVMSHPQPMHDALVNNTIALFHAEGGAIVDSGTHNLSIQTSGTPAYAQPRIAGSSFDFNGSGNFYAIVNEPNILNTGSGTFECWYNPRVSSSVREQTLIWAGQYGGDLFGPTNEMYLIVRSGTNRAFWEAFNSGGTQVWNMTAPASTALTSGTWTHLAGTWSGSGQYAKLYVNGGLVASGIQTTQLDIGSAFGFMVGAPHIVTGGAGSRFALGRMDEVRISNKARPVNELNYLTTYLGSDGGSWTQVGPNGLVI